MENLILNGQKRRQPDIATIWAIMLSKGASGAVKFTKKTRNIRQVVGKNMGPTVP
jgi:hypothetical protein